MKRPRLSCRGNAENNETTERFLVKPSIFLATLAVALLLPFAADAGQFVDVVATGHGSTVREATKAALRAAVEQVVGTMVDATTLVENDELIEDEILSYSVGMVESAKQIGEPKKSEDGFYTVKVKATVRKGKLEEKLQTASAVNIMLDGADLFARMTAAQDNLADAEAIIADVLAKHLACIVAEAVPGENGKFPLDLDPKTGEVFANVHVQIDMDKYRQFAKEVLDKLGTMANESLSLQGTGYDNIPYPGQGCIYLRHKLFDSDELVKRPYGLFVLENPKTAKTTLLFFDKNRWSAIRNGMDTGSVAGRITLTDSTGNEMSVRTQVLDQRDESGFYSTVPVFGLSDFRYRNTVNLGTICPFFNVNNIYNSLNRFFKINNNSGSLPCERSLRVPLGTFSANELKVMGKWKSRSDT